MLGLWTAVGMVLKQAPLVISAADALFARSRQRRAATSPSAEMEALRQRIAELEHHQQASAELAKQLADHAAVVASAMQTTAAKVQQAIIIGITGAALGLLALVIALMR